ncbi:CaiB/BaiF CoA transferase family protein [Paraburkholderia sp. EG287A]|uniref:CaiB/BaiF CoA transferase family protein n=1 Tax=unclassified Paraburkholderia TaxID=2615204 RepID=UPI0034D2DBAB
MTSTTNVLEGLRVLSFCHYLQGPAAGQYLADMGADVVKVEPPSGAFERHWAGADTFVKDVSAFYLCGNRNKRSLAIDVKQPEGREIVLRLARDFDVVLENFRPGVMDRLGLGYEDIRKVKPDIIYASASGFGTSGPDRDRPGQDLLVQARTGLVAATAVAGTAPTAVGCAVVDQHGASLLAMGILGAYVRRLKTGKGTRVEASLLNAGIDLQAEALTLYYSGNRDANILRRDSHLATWFHAAPYGVYRAVDAHIVLSLNEVGKLAQALRSDELATAAAGLVTGSAYTERDALATLIAAAIAPLTYDALSSAFDAAGIWYQKVQNYDELRHDPQVVHNECFREVNVGERVATLVAHPLRYDGSTPGLRHLALSAGEDTSDVLAELGMGADEVEELERRGIVRATAAADATSCC